MQSRKKLLLRLRTKEAMREEVAAVCAKAHVRGMTVAPTGIRPAYLPKVSEKCSLLLESVV